MPVESKTKGTMILRSKGRFYKVLKLRSTGDNNYTFECNDFDTKENKILQYKMSGLLEALDQAVNVLKNPKDVFFLDMDHDGKWKIVREDQLNKLAQ